MIPVTNLKSALIVALAIGTICRAEDKGSCPLSQPYIPAPKKTSPPQWSAADKNYFGTVTLQVVINDKGNVCSAHTLRGPSKEFNKQAEKAVQGWHFHPAQKDGHAMPVAISLDVKYHTTGAGEIVIDPHQSQSSVSSNQAENKIAH